MGKINERAVKSVDRDVIIIGGGPGGYVAAIRASQLKAKVTLIEEDKIGGTCLNRGCIPTKALYREAEILNVLKRADEFGINIGGYRIDVDVMQKRKQKIVDELTNGIENLLMANHVEVVQGRASFVDRNTISVECSNGTKTQFTGENIIIATGSKPKIPNIPGIDDAYTSEDILNFKEVPKSLAVIGGGVIGIEIASIFSSMGTKVDVIEFLPSILQGLDSDIVKRIVPMLKRRGISVSTSCKVTMIEKHDGMFTVHFEGRKGEMTVEAEKVLVSTGRIPNIDGLGMECTRVDFDRKGIRVDENYETNVKGIYAIGDVNGITMLAHAASHQGIAVVENIMGMKRKCSVQTVPACVFSFPEIAFAGITEDYAKAKQIPYKTSKFMFGANGKALTMGEGEGFVKVISDDKDVITGVHILGPHASDLISEGTIAINKKLTVKDIKNTIHAHPTLSEAFYESVLGLDGESIHMMPKR